MSEKKEQRAIDYLRSQLDMNNPETVLAVYTQIIEQEVFHTRRGFDFLQELKDYLHASGTVDPALVPEFLPVNEEITSSDADSGQNENIQEQEKREEIPVESVLEAPIQKEQEKPKPEKPKEKDSPIQSQTQKDVKVEKTGKEKNLLTLSLILNAVLAVMVIVMFILTLTSNSPNIINYRTKLEDEYASWDESLKQKEEELRKLEQQLNNARNDLETEMYVDEEYDE